MEELKTVRLILILIMVLIIWWPRYKDSGSDQLQRGYPGTPKIRWKEHWVIVADVSSLGWIKTTSICSLLESVHIECCYLSPSKLYNLVGDLTLMHILQSYISIYNLLSPGPNGLLRKPYPSSEKSTGKGKRDETN